MARRPTPDARAASASAPATHRVFIGIGSNLADPRIQIDRACAALARLPGTRLVARSSLYRTAPHGVNARQPDYVNAVAEIATTLAPEELLRGLQQIERAQRRRRSAPNAPRSIDLDLLLYGARRRRSRTLQIPHPRLHERAFVLKPLLQLAPSVHIPGLGCARKYLLRTRGQRVVRESTERR